MLSKWAERFDSEKVAPAGAAMNVEFEIRRLQNEVSTLKQIVNKAFLRKYSPEQIVDALVDTTESLLQPQVDSAMDE